MTEQAEYLIGFTQYHLPDGAKSQQYFVCYDAEIYRKAQAIFDKGAHFDAEILTTGKVSFTCELGDKLIAIVLSNNDESVVENVHTLIETAYSVFYSGKEAPKDD